MHNVKVHKKIPKKTFILCTLHLAIYFVLWYNNSVKGRGAAMPTLQGSKKFLRNFQKPLDKCFKMWYNIDTNQREE
jgi:hypothetical protein